MRNEFNSSLTLRNIVEMKIMHEKSQDNSYVLNM